MSSKRKVRLTQVYTFLQEVNGFGATLREIAEELGLKPSSYIRSLLEELISYGQVVKQPEIFPSTQRMKYYIAYSSVSFVSGNTYQQPLYDPVHSQVFDNDHCFLCGIELVAANRSDEHVFPRWLQRTYNLWNHKLGLLNNTDVPYRQLVIPCCSTCNSIYLSRLEKIIKYAHDGGFNEFVKLPKLYIFLWAAKMFYGILFKELSLLVDRADPAKGFILSDELLEKYATLHYFLQAVRLPFLFRGFHPWSIFVFRTISYEDERNFDYWDALNEICFSIRMGEIGAIVCLEDAGVQETLGKKYFEEIQSLCLHPIQFDEISAQIAYSARLMNRIPTYLISEGKSLDYPITVVCVPIRGLTNKWLFDEWDSFEYAQILHLRWAKYDIPFNQIFFPPGLVKSMLRDDTGQLLQLNPDGDIEILTPPEDR